MSVQALVIVNSENIPLLVRTRNPETDGQTVCALFHLHSSLDIIDEKHSNQSNRDPFIGLLTQSETHKIYGYSSASNTKILFMVSPQAIRDNEARLILKTVHNSYVDVTSGNPFYHFGQQIRSKHRQKWLTTNCLPIDWYKSIKIRFLNKQREVVDGRPLLQTTARPNTTDHQRGEGGIASQCSGGKDANGSPRPLRSSIVSTTGLKANPRWVPPSSIRRDVQTLSHQNRQTEDKNNVIFRRVRGILNKITPEKFKKLSKELLGVGLDSPAVLKGVILLIFDKALEEPKYSSMYAQLCRIISEEAPNFETNRDNTGPLNKTFCRLLLAKCQDEFENRRRASEEFDNKDGPLTAGEEEQRSVAKHKMLGNIKFICELGKQQLLQESILHLCIRQLLSKQKRDQSTQEKAQDLECLCQIMKTVGRLLDNEKAKALMNQYFERMEYYSTHRDLHARIRFMLQDVLELRRNHWLPRRVQREAGPRTILQIREEAAKDYGVYMPPPQYTFGPLRPGQMKGGQRGDEMFGLPYGFHLGTGPGAINDVLNSNGPYMGRRNPMGANQQNAGHNYPGYQFQNQPKREQMNARQAPQPPQQQQVQANSASANNQAGGWELPPRFQKQLQQQQQPPPAPGNQPQPQLAPMNPLTSLANHHTQGLDTGGISLRPAMNSMVSKPNIPLTKLSMTNTTLNIQNNNINAFEPNIMSEANKSVQSLNDANNGNKSVTIQSNKDAILKKAEDALQELLSEKQTIDEVIARFKEMKIPKNFQRDVLVTILKKSLESSEGERETSSQLLNHLKAEDVIGANIFMNAFKDLINQIEDLETYIPRVKSYVAAFMSTAIADGVVALEEASEPLEGGQHYPLLLLCLQHLHKTKGNVWLSNAFNESKINLIQMLPENDRNKERLADILEDRALGFLYPMLKIESDLWKQLVQADCTPNALYRWLKDNVDPSLQMNVEFIRVLFTCLLKYITNEGSKQSITDSESQTQTQINGTNITDHEKEILTKYQSVLKAFLNEKHSLQLIALYALQSFCFALNFPKGMLLRWFLMLYDSEVIEEEVFIKWKEDINDEYPGKGKALFQVNQWLTWLEEAEEEDEDEESEQILN